MSVSIMSRLSRTGPNLSPVLQDDEECPDYEAAVSITSDARSPHSIRWSTQFDDPLNPYRGPPPNTARLRPLPRHERYLYTYRLVAGNTPLQFLISVEPESGKPRAGKYTFHLAFKANGVERPLCEPVVMNLKVDPRQLEFAVFVFPGKNSIPVGCLWSLRVWLRVNGIDHRLFGEDELLVGKDPDFNCIGEASFARLKQADAKEQVYHAYVGRALVSFIIKWERVSNNLYKYSLEYEGQGVGAVLLDDFRLKLDSDPKTVSFLIYTVPSNSIPAGASHKLRIWLRSLVPMSPSDPSPSYNLPFNDSYIYQRVWKTDSFKIGARLDFDVLGQKMVMGFSSGGPQTIVMPHPPRESPPSASTSRIKSWGDSIID